MNLLNFNMNQHGINTKNKIPKLNSYNAYTKINSKIKKDYKPNSNNNNSVYHEDNSLRLSRQRSPCNREENKSVRSISIQTKKKKFNSYTKSVDYRNTRIDNIITDAKANLNIPNSSGKPLSSHKSLMSTAKFEKIKNSSNDLMLLQNESMEIQEQYQTTYGSQCIKQCQTKFNKDILDKIKNRLIVKSHTIKSITSHNTSKTSGKKEMIKDNLNNSLQKKLNSTHFNLNKGSNSSHTNSKHHNAKSKSISLIDELMTFNKTKSLKSNLRERLLENSTKLSTNFNNYVNRFNNKLAKVLSQVGSNRTSTLETTHFTRQDNQQEETKTEQTSNREEELFPKPKSSTFKNLCTSEKFFNEMGSKNFLISHNTSCSLLSKLSEESVFDSRNSKKSSLNNSSLKQKSLSNKHSSNSSNDAKDNKGSLLKEQEMTVSYTLSEEDEETVIKSKRYSKLNINITETEDFRKFYNEMNLKLFNLKK